ncbi:MAG: tRNA epoxyqueuosine(34) reductase QueG [Deltaproteobacteria bacterium]
MSPGSPNDLAEPAGLARWLKAEARAVGFDLCGIARAEPLDGSELTAFLAEGREADMAYLRRRVDERLDPGVLLPGARSVVALAVNYYRDDARPRIARYAQGRDYHLFLQRRLRKLRRRILALRPGAKVHPSTDTSPVWEKVWAQRAGLGWVGKNGLLITPEHGSWVLLATLVTDVELAPDAPHEGRCGGCQACLPACPTGALLGAGRLDARRCLSYWTIETRGPIPEALRPAAADWTFGCDACQDACPWNRSPAAAALEDFAPWPLTQLRCSELASLTRERFDGLAQGTPLRRAGFDGLRRSALIGLLREADPQAAATCERLSNDPSEVVRETARWVAARLA